MWRYVDRPIQVLNKNRRSSLNWVVGGGGGVHGAILFVSESFLKWFNLSRRSEEL